jgi:hypothetical protein
MRRTAIGAWALALAVVVAGAAAAGCGGGGGSADAKHEDPALIHARELLPSIAHLTSR